jgi:hypothetical protein
VFLAVLPFFAAASAADDLAPAPEDELPIPTLTLDRIPPRYSYEMALQVSYGEVAFFQETVPPWVGFGFRGGWGKNFGMQRIGLAGGFAAEGELGVNTLLTLEPAVAWDYVTPGEKGGLQIGASVGGAVGYAASAVTVDTESSFVAAPSASVRIGWSQGWTRVGRRLFVFLEPKVRFASDGPAPVVALAVGSGGGR